MNKIVALGMAALGVSSIQVSAQALSTPPAKPWNVSATLRGFYDDNVNTSSGANKQDAFGFEISPGIGLKWQNAATVVDVGYRYSLQYYDSKPNGNTSHYDQTHTFSALLDHTINDRFRLSMSDSFVIGQEPDALRLDYFGTPQHVPGNNIRNYGALTLNAQWTPVFGSEFGYDNAYYNYADDFNNAVNQPLTPVFASNSGTLDRVENSFHIEANYRLAPETTGLIGYQFTQVDFTGDEAISGINNLFVVKSNSRNSRSHAGYLGATQVFSPDFTGSLKAGIEYTDFYTDDTADSEVGPYIQGSLNYNYAPESYARLGFSQRHRPTYDSTSKNADTSVLFGSITHRIVPRLFGSAVLTFQNSTFNQGPNDGKSEQYYQLGLNLEYRLNAMLSTEIGYNYDKLVSDVSGRDYDRNRVYIGVTASY
jgi:hypothetical protein